MSFWSGEKLARELPTLVEPFLAENIDCAAYTLSVGREVYISPTDQTPNPQEQTVRLLSEREGFAIPPGQFAFLLTEQVVRVPTDAIAFISMKARIKFRGLINVSGFHVDPGFKGKLVFAVFNAAPVAVHLRSGDACFLIWYADLDAASARVKNAPEQIGIPSEIINGISGELQSFQGLAKKIKDVEKGLSDRVQKVEQDRAYFKGMIVIGVLVLGAIIKTWLFK